jgi:hypothetical protein
VTLKAIMNIYRAWKLLLLTLITAMLAIAPRAVADDINPDADVPDISTLSDPAQVNPVLEIPQQCDQDSVAVLCDRSADDSSAAPDANADADATNVDANDANAVANNPDVGSVYDYANQNITNDASAMGTTSVPLGAGVVGYPALAPAPVVVSSVPIGPGSYPQWVPGPGAYRNPVPGPGFLAPMPFSRPRSFGGGFAMHSFFGGGHFGRR